MVSAIEKITGKGEKSKLQQSGDHNNNSSLQQLDTREFALEALREKGCSGSSGLTEYSSVINMVERLRHRNPDCHRTAVAYITALSEICRLSSKTPDEIIAYSRSVDEEQLSKFFLVLDTFWIRNLNSPNTRLRKWATLRTFLWSNGIRNARFMQPNIELYRKYLDYVLTKEDCRKILQACKDTPERLLISLLIESLQRIGTVNTLTWGDMQPHLEKHEDIFLVLIGAARSKRNIEHWMPIGRMSAYQLNRRREELATHHIEITPQTPLFTKSSNSTTPMTNYSLAQKVHRIMVRAGVAGNKQGETKHARYEKTCHDFRKFGVVQMQRHEVNQEVIFYLMGHRTDSYSSWRDQPDELLRIYTAKMPRLEEQDTLEEIADFAKSRGFILDSKSLTLIRRGGDITTSTSSGQSGSSLAGA